MQSAVLIQESVPCPKYVPLETDDEGNIVRGQCGIECRVDTDCESQNFALNPFVNPGLTVSGTSRLRALRSNMHCGYPEMCPTMHAEPTLSDRELL